MTQWTDERIGTLTRLWSEDVAVADIAAELKTGRNEVIGKAHRLGLPAHSNKFGRKLRAGNVVRPKLTQKPKTERGLLQFTSPTLPTLPPMPNGSNIPHAQRCTLLQLTSGICRWPFGEVGSPDFFFCGGDAIEGKPYCASHCQVAYKARAA